MAIGNDWNVMANSVQVETSTRTPSNGTLAVFMEPLHQMFTMTSVAAGLTPKDPRGEWMRFFHFNGAAGRCPRGGFL